MSSARQRAERLLEKYFAPDDFTAEWMPGVIADLERALLDYARERVEEFRDRAAGVVFDKVRCDDRTDRWQVANEIAAHVRALKVDA